MNEREAIAQIIDELPVGWEHEILDSLMAADRIVSEHIEPLRRLLVEWRKRAEAAEAVLARAERELDRVCDLGEKRLRERDAALTRAEEAERRLSNVAGPSADVLGE